MVFLPRPFSSSQAVIFFLASGVGRPVMEISGTGEFTEVPSSGENLASPFWHLGGWTHLNDRQIKFLGKLKIALVMRRHGHDRAGAVAGENVVGNPDRNFLAVDGIDGVSAGEHAGFFFGQFGAFEIGFAARREPDNSRNRFCCSGVVISSTSRCSGEAPCKSRQTTCRAEW